MTRINRQSNIELLRILAVMGVIVLHYNNRSMGGGFLFTQSLPINHFILKVIESVNISAVDLFMLISGYFLITSDKRNILKPIQLFFQVIIFSVGGYLGLV